MNYKNRGLACVLALGLFCSVTLSSLAKAAAVNRDVPDTLTQQAMASSLALRSALNAAAQAGDRLVVAGTRGHILYSDDHGQRWKQANVPVSVSLTGLCFSDATHGWAVGHRGVILATRDGGESWALQLDGFQAARALYAAQRNSPKLLPDARRMVEEGADKPFLAVQCLGGNRVLAIGAYGLAFSSDDGGASWRPVLGLLDSSDALHFYAVQQVADQLYVAGEFGRLMRIGSDLRHAMILDEPYEGSFFGVLATRRDTLLAFGLRGHLFRSVDRGQSWLQVPMATSKSLSAGTRLADGGVLLADESGQGWLSRDDGRTFQAVSAERRFPLVALLATPDGGSLAVGVNGITRFPPSALR